MSDETPQSFSDSCESNPLFQKFSKKAKSDLLKIATRQRFKSGEFIFYAAESNSKDFFIVESGKLILSLGSGRFKTFVRGDLFGEIGVLNGRPRMGSVQALEDSSLICFDGQKINSPHCFDPETTLEIYKGLTGYVISYLDDAEYQQSTRILLNKGEGVKIEFKESLSKVNRPSVIRTICAFFNTRGGVILIGVRDNKQIIGLKGATEKEIDRYKLIITQYLKDYVGSQFCQYLTFNTEKFDDKKILRINCIPTPFPAILESPQDQAFYVRSGPSNIKAPNIKEILSYYDERFANRSPQFISGTQN